ncbi:hypothetical protein [Pseudomonas phage Nerthus]|uniref:Uncharacterized protein n=1 Tax=Pseudomonas phage Nerthus TaxID=2163984 RepID=A0A2S1GMQ0_9CAUD|nr:hypothetical protein HOT09_gp24 [Pseudomonas phage Nerthus]AWD90656.1 hypothetical protein [Pseudomonas phage Nerthus]
MSRHAYFSNIGFQRGLHRLPLDLSKVPVDCRFKYRQAYDQAFALPNSTNPRPPKGNWFLRLLIWLLRFVGLLDKPEARDGASKLRA